MSRDPDRYLADHGAAHVATKPTDLQVLILPLEVDADPSQWLELQAGNHRFTAMNRWGRSRSSQGAQLLADGDFHKAGHRPELIEVRPPTCSLAPAEKQRFIPANAI